MAVEQDHPAEAIRVNVLGTHIDHRGGSVNPADGNFSFQVTQAYRIENGKLALTIAPEFCGSAISLTRGSEELLRSAYPTARPLAWSAAYSQ